ncbi:MAG: transcriptional regulator PpsR [Gammaproteobacteria bacterium]|nr:transcriptional regulator PpsR [Pseudomonadales bacterium]MCP5347036.1 transcriptional regulator PpsR [Pseudomonadales bacterium]
MKHFNNPTDSFAQLTAEEAATLIDAATDIALVIDADGIIRDLSYNTDDLPPDNYEDWLNRPWLETVTVESRPKVKALLTAPASEPASKWRHINHPSLSQSDLPVLYTTVPLGSSGRLLAIGRSAVGMAELQQRLLRAQQAMEQHYLKIRHLETRYRSLFQACSEAVIIVDSNNLKILEANSAAEQLLGEDNNKLPGKRLSQFFTGRDATAIEKLLAEIRATGQRGQLKLQPADQQAECLLHASLCYQDGSSHFLLTISAAPDTFSPSVGSSRRERLLKIVESAPDCFVVTDTHGRIIAANQAFLTLTQTAAEERIRGESLDKWFGRSGVDLNVLMANLRKHGSVRLFATTLRGEYGSQIDVEVSATQVVTGDDETSFGFLIRDIGTRFDDASHKQHRLSRPVEQLTELVGRLPLKDLVQESTDMVERYCIEAALEITGENRTSAAEILGLSRQSLYVKLRRYGIGNFESENRE